MTTHNIIAEALAAKAAIARQTGDMLGAWWKMGDVAQRAAEEGVTLTTLADSIGFTKGSLSKAVTIRSAYDRPSAIDGETVAQAYNNARVVLGKVTEHKVAKFDAAKVLAKLDKRQRRAVYALLAAEFGA